MAVTIMAIAIVTALVMPMVMGAGKQLDRTKSHAGAAATLVVGALFAVEVARLSVASSVAETRPALASHLAPNSPFALLSAAMGGVGRSAASGGDPDQQTLDALKVAAGEAPLQPEPFLVQGALAERAGDMSRGEALLTEARLRNPRSNAARYLLADVWLRQGKVVEGLTEMAVLSRLFPEASVQLVPALSDYAQSPGARQNLAQILQTNSQLKRPLLNALASDPGNAELVLDLAGSDVRSADKEANRWKARLLGAFVSSGAYQQAYDLWRNFAGLSKGAAPLLYNGDFNKSGAPPPFNWIYNSGPAGFAESDNSRLRVLYYGRQDAPLAAQLLLLRPGSYRFSIVVSGSAAAGALVWTVTCAGAKSPLMQLDVAGGTSAAFTIPAGCRAQTLALDGHLQDVPKDSDIQMGPARIQKVAS
jgi:hypothetical protein